MRTLQALKLPPRCGTLNNQQNQEASAIAIVIIIISISITITAVYYQLELLMQWIEHVMPPGCIVQ